MIETIPLKKLALRITNKRSIIFQQSKKIFHTGIKSTIYSLFIVTFIVQGIKVTTESMKNTLLPGDFILVNKLIFNNFKLPFCPQRSIRRGDLVVFKLSQYPNTNFVKRVIGLPGETIEIRGTTIFINGNEIPEQYSIVDAEHDKPNNAQPLEIIFTPPNPSVNPTKEYTVYYTNKKKLSPSVSGSIDFEFPLYSVNSPYLIPENYYFCLGDNRDNSEDSRVMGGIVNKNIIGQPIIILYSTNNLDNPEPHFIESVMKIFTHLRWNRMWSRTN